MTVTRFTELSTERLRLRQWRDSDLDAWAAMNADPQVREFWPELLTRAQAAASLESFRDELARRGWGWWAVEEGLRRRGHAARTVEAQRRLPDGRRLLPDGVTILAGPGLTRSRTTAAGSRQRQSRRQAEAHTSIQEERSGTSSMVSNEYGGEPVNEVTPEKLWSGANNTNRASSCRAIVRLPLASTAAA
jgi:hypothetical protein